MREALSTARPQAAIVFRFGLLLAASLIWLAFAACTSSAAVEKHLFDPTLSLTGGCSTEALDSVKDPWCPGPPGPSEPFEQPNIVIDYYGNMFVASWGDEEGKDGRVDVFSPEGEFITEFAATAARDIAVDTKGNLYVLEYTPGVIKQISRYSPTTYKPESGEIAYEDPPVVVVEELEPELGFLAPWAGLAVDPSSGHVFVSYGTYVAEFDSAEEENTLLDSTIGQGVLSVDSKSLAVDASRNRLFVSDSKGAPDTSFIQVFELKAPHKHLGLIDGGATPGKKFLSDTGYLTVDADEETGHVFVSDLDSSSRVYEFGPGLGEEETYVEKYEHKFSYVSPGEVAIDNGPTSPNRGTLYVPSGGAVDHTYAFKFFKEGPPIVEAISFGRATEEEAVLRATVNPEGADTTYRFEYLTQQAYEEAGEAFTGATVAGEGSLAAGIEGKDVSTPVAGLEPGTRYRFRIVATNSQGEDEAEAILRTFPSQAPFPACPNEPLRTGLSARLPDCRAYELVSPPDTNGRAPLGVGNSGVYFPTLEASADGDKATFRIEGGSLPGNQGSGAFNGENYLATRTATGWSTRITAPSGTDYLAPLPGSVSPDQEYSFWGGEVSEEPARYLLHPDGHSELVGRGSLGEDHNVEANLIAEDAAHVIFTTRNVLAHKAPQLEPNAPPEGTTAVYDRTADGTTHVVSLLPGDVTPGQSASYVGASFDGEGIAFRAGGTLYLRHQNEATYAIGEGVTYAGIAEGGGRIFYLEGGDLLAFDVATEKAIAFSESGDVTPVNVSSDGTAAYFASPSVLTEEANPNGDVAQPGKDNLYLSEEGAIAFVATVTELDMAGEPLPNGQVLGLGQWISSLATGRPGQATSRTAPDGSVLLFESEAQLTDYDPQDHTQIYRYDSVGGMLECLSCNPTLAPASSDASLQTVGAEATSEAPVSTHARMPNLTADGARAFFQSSEALVLGDTDGGRQDVYEWEAQGAGSCIRPEGCVYLISSGRSARDNYLFSASEDGEDVFFLTSSLLLGADRDETPSLYDARVGGGFPEPLPEACEGEGCRPGLSAPPAQPVPAVPDLGAEDEVKPRKCPKGKRKVVRRGEVKCIKKKQRRQTKARRTSAKWGGAGR